MAAQPKPELWVNVRLAPEEKIMARGGDDLVYAARLTGPGARFVDHRFTDMDGRAVDEDNPRLYGTNFVAKPIDRFNLLDAMEEALGTDTYTDRAREWDLMRRGPRDLYGSLHDNAQHVIKMLLGKDPITGEDYPRTSETPHERLDRLSKGIQAEGRSALEVLEKSPSVKTRR